MRRGELACCSDSDATRRPIAGGCESFDRVRAPSTCMPTTNSFALESMCPPCADPIAISSLSLAMDDGQLKDAWLQRQEPGGSVSTAVNPAPVPSASPPPPQSAFDIRSFSLFPSTLSDSPHHHSPSHSIVTLSEGAPRDVPPSPYLSESPTLAPQAHAHVGSSEILNDERLIVNVWASNLQEELAKIVAIVDDYPYIAMDTEFPGVVARPTAFKTSSDYAYQTLKCNVDILKIIQLGLCFCDAKGNIHPGTCTWQVRSEAMHG